MIERRKYLLLISITRLLSAIGFFLTLRAVILKGFTLGGLFELLGVFVIALVLPLYKATRSVTIPGVILLGVVTALVVRYSPVATGTIAFPCAVIWIFRSRSSRFSFWGVMKGAIAKQVHRVAEVVNHIRRYSRRSENMVLSAVDLNSVVRGVVGFLGTEFRKDGIGRSCDLGERIASIRGDAVNIEQVFVNLFMNARNALAKREGNGRRIRVVTRELPDGSAVVTEVIDNGIGIAPAVRENLFKPFFTTSEPGKGTGLRLSIFKKILDKHGATISIENNAEGGATVRHSLPVGTTS